MNAVSVGACLCPTATAWRDRQESLAQHTLGRDSSTEALEADTAWCCQLLKEGGRQHLFLEQKQISSICLCSRNRCCYSSPSSFTGSDGSAMACLLPQDPSPPGARTYQPMLGKMGTTHYPLQVSAHAHTHPNRLCSQPPKPLTACCCVTPQPLNLSPPPPARNTPVTPSTRNSFLARGDTMAARALAKSKLPFCK